MSVNLMGETLSQLELMPSLPFQMIVKRTPAKDLKSLRLASKTLRNRIAEEEKRLFKRWDLDDIKKYVTDDTKPKDVERFSSEVNVVEGLKMCMYVDQYKIEDWRHAFKHLFNSHPELKNLRITFNLFEKFDRFVKFLPIVGHILKDTRIMAFECPVADGLHQLNPGCLPVLEKLKYHGILSNSEVAHLFKLCGPTLKTLHLLMAEFTENFVPKKCRLPALEKIIIMESNTLTDKGLAQLLGCAPNIKYLKLGETNITGKGFHLRGQQDFLPLTEIYVYRCPLDGTGFKNIIKKCPQLKVVSLYATYITGKTFSNLQLSSSPQIYQLDLMFCPRLTNACLVTILKKIGANLKMLKVTEANITCEAFHRCSFNFVPKLDTLDLYGCKMLTLNGVFSIVSKLGAELRVLNLIETMITAKIPSWFSSLGLTKLEELNLSSCSKLNDIVLVWLLSKLGGKLKFLQLEFTGISGKDFPKPTTTEPKLLPELETLDVNFCRALVDNGLTTILDNCGTKLKKLILTYTEINGQGIVDTRPGSLAQLEELNLGDCQWVTESVIVQILNKCVPKLKILDLRGTQLTGVKFANISVELSSLETLIVRECRSLTRHGLRQMLEKLGSNLKELNIYQTAISEKDFKENFAGLCPVLQHLQTEEHIFMKTYDEVAKMRDSD